MTPGGNGYGGNEEGPLSTKWVTEIHRGEKSWLFDWVFSASQSPKTDNDGKENIRETDGENIALCFLGGELKRRMLLVRFGVRVVGRTTAT